MGKPVIDELRALVKGGALDQGEGTSLSPEEVKELVTQWDEAGAAVDRLFSERRQYEIQRDAAMDERNATLKQFADLKERLHAAELQNARHEGYRQRVAEDDIARDGHEAIFMGEGEVAVRPRRPNATDVPAASFEWTAEEMVGSRRKPRVHWVNYGR